MSYLAYAHMFEPEKEATTIWKQPKVAGSIKVASVLIDKGYEYLSISGLGNNGCVELANMIRDKPRGLKKIQIDNNNIGDKGGVALFEVLADNKTIESLEMGENSIGAQTMKQALDTLRTNKTLVYLDLGQNRGLHSSGVMLLSAGLKRNSTLQSLCLNRCGIPPKGLIALAEGLESNNGVTFLNINANQMASPVGVAFANMLKKNKTLQKLSMGGGSKQLGDKGFIPIAEALDTNTSLSYLNVQKNNIKDQGALRFGITLTKNSTLQRIDLSRNSFTSKGMHSFIEGMKVNKTLFSLFVDDFTSSQGSELYELVKLNETTNNLQEMDIFLNILKDGNQRGPLMRSKLMVIGQGMSGKTATVRSLLGEPFEEKWKSTIGANVRESKVTSKQGWVGIHKSQKFEYTKDFVANLAVKQIDRKNASEVHLSKGMEDVEEKKFMVGENMKGEQEITALEKKDGLEDDDDDEVEKSEIAAKIHRIKSSASSKAALANVHDEVGMSAPMSGYKEVARKFKEDLLTTAKTERDALKFSIWDYGGQRVFYSLHHLFLTKFGIYMLIFDMRQMLKNPGLCRVYLQFWLHSLSLHAPETPLMLVGTYLDEVSAQEDMVTINQRVASNLENFPFNVIQNEHDRLLFFPISNKQGLGISSVRVFLDRTARQQKYVHMQVPLTWIYTLEALMKEHLEWVSLTEFKQYASKNRVHDGKEIKAMLELFHELGLMLHLTQTSSLKEVVTLNPQWLITSIGRIIRDNKLHAHNMEKLEKNGLGEDVKTLFADGLASDSLCRFLWNDSQVDYLLDLMRQTLLICDWNFNRGETDEHKNKNYYLVPSVITGSKDLEEYDDDEEAGKDFKDGGAAQVKHDKEVKNKVYENKNLRNICAFEFGFLPDGVYDRLVCLCVAHSNLIKASKAPLITSTHCEITFDNNAVIQLYEKKEIETIYMELRNNPETLNQASNCLVIVQSMLKKLRSDIIGLGLTWEVFFPQSDRTLMSQDKASDLNLAPWFSKLTRAEYIKKTTNVDHIDVASFLGRFQDM